MVARRYGVGLLLLLLILIAPSAAKADVEVMASAGSGSLEVRGLQAAALQALADQQWGSVTAASSGPFFEYTSVAYCPGASVGGTFDDFCLQATLFCASNSSAQGLGPAVRIMRREVDTAGVPLPGAEWVSVGVTCFPDQVPGSAPVLTMAMVLEQFHRTAFALPDLKIQPVGNATLVNLPTFYEVVWAPGGFAPESIDTTTILGRRVEIRPTLGWVDYDFGDGSSSGRDTSLGGPYPHGSIRHTYGRPGPVQVQATVSYGGEFRVDGGQWIRIPDTVEILGTPQTLDVLEARARLVL